MSGLLSESEVKEITKQREKNTEKLDKFIDNLQLFSRNFHFKQDTENGLYENAKDREDIDKRFLDARKKEMAELIKRGKNGPVPCMLGGQYYQGRLDMYKTEVLFALSQGLPEDMLFSDTKEAKEKISELGEKFNKIFIRDPKWTPAETADYEKAAGKAAAKMYKYSIDNYDPAKIGDLSDDNVLFSHLLETRCINPNSTFSQYMTQNPTLIKSFLEEFQTYKEDPQKSDLENAKANIHEFNEGNYSRDGYFGLITNCTSDAISLHNNKSFRVNKDEAFDTALNSPDWAVIMTLNKAKAALREASRYTKDNIPPLSDDQAVKFYTVLHNNEGYQNKFSELENSKDKKSRNRQRALEAGLIKAALPGGKADFIVFKGNPFAHPETLDDGPVIDSNAFAWRREKAEQPESSKVEMIYRGSDIDGNRLDPNAMRDAYKNFSKGEGEFTDQQIDYAHELYERSLGKAFGEKEQRMLGQMEMSPFDCIFINGKSVHELYNERNKDMNPDALPNFAEMKTMVAAAGMYGANQITYAKPVMEGDRITFPKTEYLRRQNSKTDGLEDQKGGFWHHNEAMQDKFDRAYGDAKSREKAVSQAKPAVDKLNNAFKDPRQYVNTKALETEKELKAAKERNARTGATEHKAADRVKTNMKALSEAERKEKADREKIKTKAAQKVQSRVQENEKHKAAGRKDDAKPPVLKPMADDIKAKTAHNLTMKKNR